MTTETQKMKARPVKLVYGEGYIPCLVDDATHVTLNIPGPSGRLSLPVIRSAIAKNPKSGGI